MKPRFNVPLYIYSSKLYRASALALLPFDIDGLVSLSDRNSLFIAKQLNMLGYFVDRFSNPFHKEYCAEELEDEA